jgi:hypothetical protein
LWEKACANELSQKQLPDAEKTAYKSHMDEIFARDVERVRSAQTQLLAAFAVTYARTHRAQAVVQKRSQHAEPAKRAKQMNQGMRSGARTWDDGGRTQLASAMHSNPYSVQNIGVSPRGSCTVRDLSARFTRTARLPPPNEISKFDRGKGKRGTKRGSGGSSTIWRGDGPKMLHGWFGAGDGRAFNAPNNYNPNAMPTSSIRRGHMMPSYAVNAYSAGHNTAYPPAAPFGGEFGCGTHPTVI